MFRRPTADRHDPAVPFVTCIRTLLKAWTWGPLVATVGLTIAIPVRAEEPSPTPTALEPLRAVHSSTLADAARLVEAALASEKAMATLTSLCDGIGARLSGSRELELAVDWAESTLISCGLENVQRQPVLVPHWVRGTERAWLKAPRELELSFLGLGRSVGTPPGGIQGEVLVTPSFEHFAAIPQAEVQGKIVLWNAPFTTYSETVKYRWSGWVEASRKGAIASLVRTVGRRSLRNPHTGAQEPANPQAEDAAKPIPAAALAIEDALLIARLADAGHKPVVHLEMGAHTLPDAPSHNVFGQITGREFPQEIVVVGGHLDSWDVGQGAHDDGGGCVVGIEAVRLMKALGLTPRRTVRVCLWTNEENGTRGAEEYRRVAFERGETHVAAIESDGGVEAPWGFGLTIRRPGGLTTQDQERQTRALEYLRQISLGLEPAAADSLREGGGGADIDPLMRDGVPGFSLSTPMDLYWDIHHSDADTIDKVDPAALRKNVAAMAYLAFVLAEMPDRL